MSSSSKGTPTNQSITSHKASRAWPSARILPNGTASGVTAPDDVRRPASARQYNEQEELRPARYREKADVHFLESAQRSWSPWSKARSKVFLDSNFQESSMGSSQLANIATHSLQRRQQQMYNEAAERAEAAYKVTGRLRFENEVLQRKLTEMTRERDDMLRAAQAERNGSGVELPQKESEEAERAIMSALQMGTEAEKEVNNVEEEEPEPESANLDVLSAARARRAALMAAQRNETPAAVHAAARRALESIDEMNESNHMAMDELPNLSLTQAREVAHQMAIALAGDPIEVERTLLIAIRKDSLEPLDAILHVASSSLGIKKVDEIAAMACAAHFAASEKPALPPSALAVGCVAAQKVVAAGGNARVAASTSRQISSKMAEAMADGNISPEVQQELQKDLLKLADETAAVVREASANVEQPIVPKWSIRGWLEQQVDLPTIVSDALLADIRKRLPSGADIHAYEQGFLQSLANEASVETVQAVLKATPVLYNIALAVLTAAKALHADGKEANDDVGEEVETMLEGEELAEADGEAQDDKQPSTGRSSGVWAAPAAAASFRRRRMFRKMSEKILLNESFKKEGAFELNYATDTSLFWDGMEQLVGKPADQSIKSLYDSMAEEHCAAADSREFFEPNNYPTRTTSEIEWNFVVDPTDGVLDRLRMRYHITSWPGVKPRVSGVPPRQPRPMGDFAHERNQVDAKLQFRGEQALSDVEFHALRLYTGPMFYKYNNVLRASVHPDNAFFHRSAQACRGNRYPATLITLTKAVIKLGKIEKAGSVYRAPGGALPRSFWAKSDEGILGGIEAAFMSTTSAKQEAMHYASRGKGRVLFEIHMGAVSRGARLSWLSQYPAEAEVLFPPLTSLEVRTTRIDGMVLMVELAVAMRAPENMPTGVEDLLRSRNQRQLLLEQNMAAVEKEQAMKAALEEKERENQSLQERLTEAQEALKKAKLAHDRTKMEAEAKEHHLNCERRMQAVCFSASRRQASKVNAELVQARQDKLGAQLRLAVTSKERQDLEQQLEATWKELELAKSEVDRMNQKLREDEEKERLAIQAKEEAERKNAGVGWQIGIKFIGSAKHVQRAAAVRQLKAKQDELERLKSEQGHTPMTESQLVEQIMTLDSAGLSERFAGITAEEMKNPTGKPELVAACMDRLSSLSRKGVKEASFFIKDKTTLNSMSTCMKKYQSDLLVQSRACMALHVLLAQPGLEGAALESGLTKAIILAQQRLTVHSLDMLSFLLPPDNTKTTKVAILAVREFCNPKAQHWKELGIPHDRRKAFFEGGIALPSHITGNGDVKKCLLNQK